MSGGECQVREPTPPPMKPLCSSVAVACPQTSNTKDYDEEPEEAPATVLDEGDIQLLKAYGQGPYTAAIKKAEKEIKEHQDKVWPLHLTQMH